MKNILFISLLLISSSCAQRELREPPVFGVDKATWQVMSTEEKKQIIESHHDLKRIELENQRRNTELQAQMQPLRSLTKILESVAENQ